MLKSHPQLRRAVVTALMAIFASGPVMLFAEPIASEKAIGEDEHKYVEVEQAAQKFSAGDPEQALQMLEVAVTRHPELSPARVMLAKLYFASNQVSRGRLELEKVIVEKPDDPEAYEVLGNIALSEGRVTEAGMLYQKVAETAGAMAGESIRKHNLVLRGEAGLALVAESRAQWEKAAEYLNKWIKLDAKDAQPHIRLGQVLFKLDKPNEAYQQFQEANKLSETTPPAEILMGRLYQQTDDTKKAGEWMSLAIEREPENLAAQVGVAQWYYELENLDEAKKHADLALKIDPESVDAKLMRGVIARAQKDYAEAEKQLESAHLLAPANFTASNQLALVLSEEGDESKLRRAGQLAELNARQYSNNAEAFATLGAVYLKMGRLDQAERALARVLNSGQPISGDAAYYLAELLVKRDKGEDSRSRAKQFLRMALDAKGPFINRAAAQALYDELGKPKKS